MRRRLDAAGYRRGQDAAADGRAPVGAVRPLGQVSREHVRRPRRGAQHRGRGPDPVGRRRSDGAEADELPGARADLPPGHQVAIATCRSAWPSSAAATATSRMARCTASCACASSRRTTRISSCREDQLVEEVRQFCDLLDSVYKDLGFDDYAIKLALRPDKRFGTDEMWDRAEQTLRDAVAATGRATAGIRLGRAAGRRAPSTRPSSNST